MQADSGNKYDDINVTPMVDLYLVLLLIFIIMTTAGVQGIKVDLPKGSKAPPQEITGPKGRAVTVNNEGKIFLDTVPVSIEELEQKLTEHKNKNDDFPVVVRGDRATQYQRIMDVLDVIGKVGISKIGLATQGPK
ncbi:MAG: biopolymer transporter ExbD [Verrucomicrobiae bacterium]|nr:biopolymer transporter ExbD [Verrucomicrobiae bacterium]